MEKHQLDDGVGRLLASRTYEEQGPAYAGYGADLRGPKPVRAINLDANANSAVVEPVARAVIDAMQGGAANPASTHHHGQLSRMMIADARDVVSASVEGSFEEGVVFTSGCTEANNAVLLTRRFDAIQCTIITTAVEHPSILQPARTAARRGARVVIAPVDGKGRVDPAWIEATVYAAAGPIIVSVQHANSETGVLQPIHAIAEVLASREEVMFHSDAAQAFGRVPVRVGVGLGPDVITVSGHKIHAPMGIGAMVVNPEEERIAPWLYGGEQEHGIRAGTQAVPLIAGFAAACRHRWENWDAHVGKMQRLRGALEAGVRNLLPWATVNGAHAERLPNTSNIRFPGVDGMAMTGQLDEVGISCSLGSACTSGHPDPSHVLMAMGISRDDAFASVRFSVSPMNDDLDIATAIEHIARIATRLRRS